VRTDSVIPWRHRRSSFRKCACGFPSPPRSTSARRRRRYNS
jgi:hypothetical protein